MEPVLTGAFLELFEVSAAGSGLPSGPPSYNVVLTLGHMYVRLPTVFWDSCSVMCLGASGEMWSRVSQSQ
jgi:hypothetical protein